MTRNASNSKSEVLFEYKNGKVAQWQASNLFADLQDISILNEALQPQYESIYSLILEKKQENLPVEAGWYNTGAIHEDVKREVMGIRSGGLCKFPQLDSESLKKIDGTEENYDEDKANANVAFRNCFIEALKDNSITDEVMQEFLFRTRLQNSTLGDINPSTSMVTMAPYLFNSLSELFKYNVNPRGTDNLSNCWYFTFSKTDADNAVRIKEVYDTKSNFESKIDYCLECEYVIALDNGELSISDINIELTVKDEFSKILFVEEKNSDKLKAFHLLCKIEDAVEKEELDLKKHINEFASHSTALVYDLLSKKLAFLKGKFDYFSDDKNKAVIIKKVMYVSNLLRTMQSKAPMLQCQTLVATFNQLYDGMLQINKQRKLKELGVEKELSSIVDKLSALLPKLNKAQQYEVLKDFDKKLESHKYSNNKACKELYKLHEECYANLIVDYISPSDMIPILALDTTKVPFELLQKQRFTSLYGAAKETNWFHDANIFNGLVEEIDQLLLSTIYIFDQFKNAIYSENWANSKLHLDWEWLVPKPVIDAANVILKLTAIATLGMMSFIARAVAAPLNIFLSIAQAAYETLNDSIEQFSFFLNLKISELYSSKETKTEVVKLWENVKNTKNEDQQIEMIYNHFKKNMKLNFYFLDKDDCVKWLSDFSVNRVAMDSSNKSLTEDQLSDLIIKCDEKPGFTFDEIKFKENGYQWGAGVVNNGIFKETVTGLFQEVIKYSAIAGIEVELHKETFSEQNQKMSGDLNILLKKAQEKAETALTNLIIAGSGSYPNILSKLGGNVSNSSTQNNDINSSIQQLITLTKPHLLSKSEVKFSQGDITKIKNIMSDLQYTGKETKEEKDKKDISICDELDNENNKALYLKALDQGFKVLNPEEAISNINNTNYKRADQNTINLTVSLNQ